jgi:BACON domain-containing protein
MGPGWNSGRVALALAGTLAIAACTSDTLTSPPTAALNLTAAPTIDVALTLAFVRNSHRLCYPTTSRTASRFPCSPSTQISISNTGGGTLNWTANKSATWLKILPNHGTAPSAMKLWVDGTGVPSGDYSGWVKVWATGATNSPQRVLVYYTKY